MIKINKNGGGNRNRTDDILLAKQTLYHLSYTPVMEPRAGVEPAKKSFADPCLTVRPTRRWREWRDSNPRPLP